ncbi:Imm42 family immunity protein [Neisseria leonii]|uniref:Imm42 family immunity protein n=1 Tax=Neisseria leonii TaxID=2995413 RepID=A0A9X4E6J4_9NEIS|nr:Imm42 family immunity protein [Neisseria sp. 51.81]MDD9328741.1 immunity 42 family protein [Neisseria sp. 51.81]
MIFGDKIDFFIQTDILLFDGGYQMGPLNFWIDGKCYPGENALITLNSEVTILKANLDKMLNRRFPEAKLTIDKINFELEEITEENIMYMYLAELGDCGLKLRCDMAKNTLRLFYAIKEEPFRIKEISIAYYARIINEMYFFIQAGSSK